VAASGGKLEERFLAFHEANPQVYSALKRLARQAIARGHRTIGIGMLWEVLRWELFLGAEDPGDPEGYKLNNSYRSRYARLLMANEHDLFGVFETRELRT
jgi:hypothetical protein